MTGTLTGVVRGQDFADVAEQDVHSLFAVDFLVGVHRVPDETTGDNQRLFPGPFRDVKEIPFPRLAVIW